MHAGASLWWQYALIAMVVAASAWIVLVKQAPAAARRLRIALAVPLLRQARAPWLQRLGRRIAPVPTQGGACGGCDSCKP